MPSSGDALPSHAPPKPSTRHTCATWTIPRTLSSALERWCLNWRNVSDKEAQPQRTESPAQFLSWGAAAAGFEPRSGTPSTLKRRQEEGDNHQPRLHQPWPNHGGLGLDPALDWPKLRAPCQT